MYSYEEQLEHVQECIRKAEECRSYSIGTREIMYANLKYLYEREKELKLLIEREKLGGKIKALYI